PLREMKEIETNNKPARNDALIDLLTRSREINITVGVRTWPRSLPAYSSVQHRFFAKFPTHNPTHKMRCLVRLTRCLPFPAVLLSLCITYSRSAFTAFLGI